MQQETNNYNSPEKRRSSNTTRRMGILALTIFFAGVGAGVGITKGTEALSNVNVGAAVADIMEHATSQFDFSEQTKSYVVKPGEGLYNAVEHIDNIGSIPMDAAANYVKNMPENKDTLEDGLQAYETVVIPDRVDR